MYKKLVDADDWTPGPGSSTPAAELNFPAGYQDALPTETVTFQTMMSQAISAAVDAAMSASTQANIPPPGGRGGMGGWGGGGRGSMGGRGVDTKKVAFPGNCNCCGKAGHYVQ